MKNLFLLTGILLLSACQQSQQASTEKAVEAVTKNPSAVKQVATTANKAVKTSVADAATESVPVPMAIAAKKSTLKFEHRTSTERAQVGVPYTIEVDFKGSVDKAYSMQFEATPGLSMTSNNSAQVQIQKTGYAETQSITVVPQKEGIHYITIYENGMDQKQKPSAIKVIVGNKDIREYMETVGEIKEQADGSKVVSMPAEESF